MTRNYKREYQNYHSKPEQKRNRASRNAARRAMIRAGAAKKGDGKDVDHKNRNPLDNRLGNLRMISKSRNRSRK